MTGVTQILNAVEQGDPSAAEQLLPLVYDELRKLAAARMAREAPGQTLQATALVHEAYLRPVDEEKARHWGNRHVEPRKLSALVRGELDWIVMKALENDRTRRYETANAFANDIQRHLSDEPVLACPPSAAHRFHQGPRTRRQESDVQPPDRPLVPKACDGPRRRGAR